MRDFIASQQKAQSYLLAVKQADGHFEGQLSSNTYPSCAYALLELAQGRTPERALIDWLLAQQATDGMWRLDPSDRTDAEATCFARLILAETQRRDPQPRIQSALSRTPTLESQLWIIKLFEAICGTRDWDDLLPPASVRWFMGVAQKLMPLLPKALLQRAKPPTQFAPPPAFFRSSAFERLFIAEQHTIVPLIFLIELHTQRREELMRDLLAWLTDRRLSDGSWFRVHFITAISTLALLKAREAGLTDAPVEPSLAWLASTRNPDGGYREAVNLNVWDTALSVIALLDSGVAVERLSGTGEWLVQHQNPDGGWAFSGIVGGKLPSDADDTALATLALLRLGYPQTHEVTQRSLRWLSEHQAEDGSWSTYVPGAGDVGCVSVTSHAIEACLVAGGLGEPIARAARWLEREQHAEGFWEDLWLAKRTYGTACALVALIKAGHGRSEAVERGVRWLEGAQQPDAGWGEDMAGAVVPSTNEQTAWSSYALLLADPESDAARRGLEYLAERQRADGSWSDACVGIYWEVLGGYADPIYALVFPLLALSHAASGTPRYVEG